MEDITMSDNTETNATVSEEVSTGTEVNSPDTESTIAYENKKKLTKKIIFKKNKKIIFKKTKRIIFKQFLKQKKLIRPFLNFKKFSTPFHFRMIAGFHMRIEKQGG